MTDKIIRPLTKEGFVSNVMRDPKLYLANEWIVTNGLGGYSSGTIIGVATRKYHGILIAALPPPHGRYVMLNHISEVVIKEGKSFSLNCEEKPDGSLNIEPLTYLKDFYLEDGLPVWHYHIEDTHLEKRIFMSYRQNTVFVSYEHISGPDISLRLLPAIHFRPHEAPVNLPLETEYIITVIGNRYEISKKDFRPVRIFVYGDEKSGFTIQKKSIRNLLFRTELGRGYESLGDLWNPGYFHIELTQGKKVSLVASTEHWKSIDSLPAFDAHKAEILRRRLLLDLADPKDEQTKELILASDQFIIVPEHRIEDSVRAHAFGEEIRTIIAGYHWFSDWGRDTMISLEGLTLCTKRYQEARWILKTFAHYVKNGLIPNMFPEGQNTGLYNTADATLWFFHALERYFATTHDTVIFDEVLPIMEKIIHYHVVGTDFHIGMDATDKLITQGTEKYQLTWMDAKVGDWIVTPRRGKAVEINALWYNALKLMEEWIPNEKKKHTYGQLAKEVKSAFNHRFWIAEQGYLYDVVDGEKGDDPAFRPNQIFSISLKYPVLDVPHWKSVVDQVQEKLLTPYGLRTLDMEHPDFKPTYEGDLRARDAAYHQGTVWPWLIGPFIDAWLKVYPHETQTASKFLTSYFNHLSETGVGTICEIFDATPPFTGRGCIAQAWSIAEVLRTWLKINQS